MLLKFSQEPNKVTLFHIESQLAFASWLFYWGYCHPKLTLSVETSTQGKVFILFPCIA